MFGDIKATFDRDPAARGFRGLLEILFCYPGYHALKAHRVASFLHAKLRIPLLPRLLSHLARFFTGVEIHPGAKIGEGFFIDHGMGVVIGETAEIGDNCTLYQGVTLGGTGKEAGKRHPTLGDGVLVGVGAKILGNIVVGDDSYIGAGSVVLRDVPPNATVVGVPGRVVRQDGRRIRGATLDHANLPDPVLERLQLLQDEVEKAERLLEEERALPHRLLVLEAADLHPGKTRLEQLLEEADLLYSFETTQEHSYRFVMITCERRANRFCELLTQQDCFRVVSEGMEESLTSRSMAEDDRLCDHDEECQGSPVVKLMLLLIRGRNEAVTPEPRDPTPVATQAGEPVAESTEPA